MRREDLWKIEKIMNAECKRIFDECRTVSKSMKGRGVFPNTAIIVRDRSITSDGIHFPKRDCEGLFSLENDEVRPIGIPIQGIPYEKEPISGDYFYKAEFYYGIDIDKMRVTLTYLIARRWGRCQLYQIIWENEDYVLCEPSCVWVS